MSSFFSYLGRSLLEHIEESAINTLDKAVKAANKRQSRTLNSNQNNDTPDTTAQIPGSQEPHTSSAKSAKPQLFTENGCTMTEDGVLVSVDPDLHTLTIPKNVVQITSKALENVPEIAEIIVTGPIDYIDDFAFRDLKKLHTIRFENAVRHIGDHAFENCSSLVDIQFADTLTELGEGAFCSCSALIHIDIPDTCKEIGTSCFANCTSLNRVHLPRSLSYIPDRLFMNCLAIEIIDWPELRTINDISVPELGRHIFANTLCCDNWERFELINGTMKRRLVLVVDEDTEGLYDFMKTGKATHVQRIPQLIANSTLNHIWESSNLNPSRYEAQMTLLKASLELTNIVTINLELENRAERLFAFRILRQLLDVTEVSTDNLNQIMPFAISYVLFAIGGNGQIRKIQDDELQNLVGLYARVPNILKTNINLYKTFSERYQKAFTMLFFKEFGIGPSFPHRYDPFRYRYILPIPCGSNDYYAFEHAMESLCESTLLAHVRCEQDLTQSPKDDWFHVWGKEIQEQGSPLAYLVRISPDRCIPEIPGDAPEYSQFSMLIEQNPECEYCLILSGKQIEAIREILHRFDLDEMLTVYPDGLRLV